MRLLADAGLTAYRFGIECARIEPEPGQFSQAELAHYRQMIDTARELGLEPVVTLHHFSKLVHRRRQLDRRARPWRTSPRYVEQACTILGDVNWVCTINEPNMAALMSLMVEDPDTPDEEIGHVLVQAHN
ncbi:family 1 glycosylhydrolase [Streptomyces sp. NBC_00063]|uniref:family 1 glycosylhydrolase n=1 Tax=Streptomyces sp. NBC_00063 TaxID=2975638 RepID=UPI003D748C01